jgi:hypothetical protein
MHSDVFLVIDFVNLKIKSAQSFRDAHSDRVRVRVFIVGGCSYVHEYLCLYCVSKKKKKYIGKEGM